MLLDWWPEGAVQKVVTGKARRGRVSVGSAVRGPHLDARTAAPAAMWYRLGTTTHIRRTVTTVHRLEVAAETDTVLPPFASTMAGQPTPTATSTHTGRHTPNRPSGRPSRRQTTAAVAAAVAVAWARQEYDNA